MKTGWNLVTTEDVLVIKRENLVANAIHMVPMLSPEINLLTDYDSLTGNNNFKLICFAFEMNQKFEAVSCEWKSFLNPSDKQ